MREIRFRAWNKAEKRMGTVISISFLGENSIGAVVGYDNGEISFETEDTVVLIQYTGLEDSNGKKVYEGDICEHYNWGKGVIEYCDDRYVLHTEIGNCDIKYPEERMRVIGNIYEGAEPLEEE